jgi:hypothetical protein
MIRATQPRTYPFTMRITFQERTLIQELARKRGLSKAEVVRLGLNTLRVSTNADIPTKPDHAIMDNWR